MFDFIKNVLGKGGSQQSTRLAAYGRNTPGAEAGHYTVLVAQLEGDTDGAQTRHVAESLAAQFSPNGEDGVPLMRVERYPKALKLGRAEDPGAVAKAEAKGQTGLARQNADMLVWGCVSTADKVLRLRFLARDYSGIEDNSGGAKAQRYRLSEPIELPLDFHADWGAVIAILAVAGIEPAFPNADRTLADINEPLVTKLAPLAANIPVAYAGEIKALMWFAYALGELQLGEVRGDSARLETAITYFRRALSGWKREKAPLVWAMVQHSLGNAQIVLGERDDNHARLNEAVAAFREALKERMRERTPLDWSATMTNLGIVLTTLGKLENSTVRLEDAVATLRLVLEERTREHAPFSWALSQNNLGAAFQSLGERETGTKYLKEAVTVYREALEELPRSRVPQIWADTQNNLGAVLLLLGEREASIPRLEEAVAAFRASLVENTRERAPIEWAMTQNNLGNALLALGQHESSTVHLEEAIAAFNAALEERKREDAPLEWALTQHNLGKALSMLGAREGGTEHYKQAVNIFHITLEELTSERVPLHWAAAKYHLGVVLTALGERLAETDQSAACAALKEARSAYLAALGEYVRASDGPMEDDIRRKVGELGRLTAQLGCGG
jgi:tetratricopeptide (TPR) repeat protein